MMFKKTHNFISVSNKSQVQKPCYFFPWDPAKKTCSPNMNLVQTNIPDHSKHLANATVKPMKNTENTMIFPPPKRLRMDIHDLNICYPSANSFRLTANPPGKPNMLDGVDTRVVLQLSFNANVTHDVFLNQV